MKPKPAHAEDPLHKGKKKYRWSNPFSVSVINNKNLSLDIVCTLGSGSSRFHRQRARDKTRDRLCSSPPNQVRVRPKVRKKGNGHIRQARPSFSLPPVPCPMASAHALFFKRKNLGFSAVYRELQPSHESVLLHNFFEEMEEREQENKEVMRLVMAKQAEEMKERFHRFELISEVQPIPILVPCFISPLFLSLAGFRRVHQDEQAPTQALQV